MKERTITKSSIARATRNRKQVLHLGHQISLILTRANLNFALFHKRVNRTSIVDNLRKTSVIEIITVYIVKISVE